MAIFASTTLGSSDPSRAMSIKALEARAQALAAQQAKQELPTSLPSPWQGAGYLANTAADAFASRRADQAAAQRRQDLAGYMSQVGPEGPNPQLLGQITAADPEVGRQLAAQAFEARQSAAARQAAKELAAQQAQQHEAAAEAQEKRVLARPPNDDLINLKRGLQQGILTQKEYDDRVKKLNAPAPAEQKLTAQEQETNIDLQSMMGSLKEAQGIVSHPGGIYEGPGARIKSAVGENIGVPSALQGLTGIDPEKTARTQRFNQILSGPVLETLNKMKGASSDKDLVFAIDTLNNPNATLQNKQAALDTITRKMDAHMRASDLRLKGMGGTKVEVAPPPTSAAAPAAGGGGVLEEARKAIAAGAPRDKVIQRLQEKGVDASGL